MTKFGANHRGASILEACIALPVVFLSLFAAFAIAEAFFVASKVVHLSTDAAISLRAVAQAGEKITGAPAFNNLVYSPNPSTAAAQLAWYGQGATVTGFSSTSDVHKMFQNLFLGALTKIYPEASSPPPFVSGRTNLKRSIEATIVADGEDTKLQLRTAPVLGNMLRQILFFGSKELVFSSTATIADMSIASSTNDEDMDGTYVPGAGGGLLGSSTHPILESGGVLNSKTGLLSAGADDTGVPGPDGGSGPSVGGLN